MGWAIIEKDPPTRRERFVLIAEADTTMESELLASELRQAGIHAVSLSAGNVYMIQRGAVWVPEAHCHQALQILKEMQVKGE